jgi:hypothetical protein
MNERIKELADEADKLIQNQYLVRQQSEWCDKFAELIVKECLKIVEPDQTSGDEWCVTLDETAQSIRQHFGVEK